MSQQHARVAEAATRLYRGDLLEGWYQDWCLYERERLQNLYLSLLNKLMGYCEASQTYERGLAYGTEILRFDRAREQTHRGLMRLYFLAGDRTASLRQYERCAEILEKELGVSPTTVTIDLKEQIKCNRLDDSAIGVTTTDCQPDLSTPLNGLVNHLEQLQEVLKKMHEQVRLDIQTVKQVLQNRH